MNLITLSLKVPASVENLDEQVTTFILNNVQQVHRNDLTSDALDFSSRRERVQRLIMSSTASVGAASTLTMMEEEENTILLQESIDYFSHLSFVATKLPDDTSIRFSWFPLFSLNPQPAAPALSLSSMSLTGSFAIGPTPLQASSLQYERLSLLFNIALTYQRMASRSCRNQVDMLKVSLANYQNAAGVFSHLITLLPLLPSSPPSSSLASTSAAATTASDGNGRSRNRIAISPDLTVETLSALRDLCLAQGQEGVWLKGVIDRLREGTIAKLSLAVSNHYASAASFADTAKGGGKEGGHPSFAFPKVFINHCTIKSLHFQAAALFRKSIEDLSANRYGDEIARLTQASEIVKKANEISAKGIAKSVIDDLKGLQVKISDNLARATKDNTLIYLANPTPISSLPPIPAASMVSSNLLPPSIASPLAIFDPTNRPAAKPWFRELMRWEVQLAMKLYEDRKQNWFKDSILSSREKSDRLAASTLRSLSLPGSIQALSTPAGLPPLLLAKATEIRAEGGAWRMREMIKDVSRSSRICRKMIDEIQEALSTEERSDEAHRIEYGVARWSRPASATLTGTYRNQVEESTKMWDSAVGTDRKMKKRWTDWESLVAVLSGDELALEAFVPSLPPPSLTFASSSSSSGAISLFSSSSSAQLPPQEQSLRTLRGLLDDLEDLEALRSATVDQSKRAIKADDRSEMIRNEGQRFELEVAVRAKSETLTIDLFEDVLQNEMGKFGRFTKSMKDNESRTHQVLDQIKLANSTFLASRRVDPTLRARETALQELDTAVFTYRELIGNFQQGLKFYSDLANQLGNLQVAVKQWINQRDLDASRMLDELIPPSARRGSFVPLSPISRGAYDPTRDGPIRFSQS